jgi:hypothetical protein
MNDLKELLVRKPIEVTPRLGVLESETLQKAKAALGYTPAKTQSDLADSQETASELFSKLGIERFPHENIDAYKAAMLKKTNLKARMNSFYNDVPGIPLLIVSCIGTFALALISFLSYETTINGEHPFFYANWQWLFIPAVLSSAFGIFCLNLDDTEYEWVRTLIVNYQAEIPCFALSRAMEIKENYPEAQIYIESLQAQERPIADPFLVVGIKGYLYYVDVWDEPKFEGRRVK